MNKNTVFILFLFLLLIFNNVSIVRGDIEIYENQYGKLSVYPRTSFNICKQKQFVEVVSYIPTQKLDIIFRFDNPIFNPDVFLYSNVSYQEKIFIYEEEEGPNGTYEHITGWYFETRYKWDWVSIKDNFKLITYKGKYYYYIRHNIVQDNVYKFLLQYNIPQGYNGKWDLLVKKPEDSIGTWRVNIDPYYNSNWSYYKIANINSSFIDNTLKGYPILFNSTNTTFISKCDGGDSIRFVSLDNTTEFDYEIETWTPGGVDIWVNITDNMLNTSDYQFNVYYNNSAASDNQNKFNVWDSDFIAVYHMNYSSGALIDSSYPQYNSSGTHKTPDYQQPGKVGYAIELDAGTEEWYDLDNMDLTGLNSFTFEIYFYHMVSARQFIFSSLYDAAAPDDIRYVVDSDPPDELSGYMDDGVIDGAAVSFDMDGLIWYYWAIATTNTGVSGNYTMYCNDTAIGWDGSVNFNYAGLDNIHDLGARGHLNGPAARKAFDGVLDEVRFSSIQRNKSWVKFTYYITNNNSEVLTLGEERLNPPSVLDPISEETYPAQNWSLVSLPKNETISKFNVRLINDTNNYTWEQAVNNNVILTFLYGWSTDTKSYYLTNSFEGYKGYWLHWRNTTHNYSLWVDEGTGGGTVNTTNITVNSTGEIIRSNTVHLGVIIVACIPGFIMVDKWRKKGI